MSGVGSRSGSAGRSDGRADGDELGVRLVLAVREVPVRHSEVGAAGWASGSPGVSHVGVPVSEAPQCLAHRELAATGHLGAVRPFDPAEGVVKRSPMPRRRSPLRAGAPKSGAPVRRGGSEALRASERTYRLVRLEVLQRDGFRCVLCGRVATDTHHRQPRGMGGSARNADIHSPANLVSLCREHHSHTESRRAWAYGEGLLVRSGFDPAETPVRLSAGRWVLFLKDGTIAKASRRTGQISTTDEDTNNER